MQKLKKIKRFKLKISSKVPAEQKLFHEIEIGKTSADKQGLISFSDSKKAILG